MKGTTQSFLTFGVVGIIGYGVDAGVLYLVAPWVGLYAGRTVSFVAAMSATFVLNRIFTFRDSTRAIGLARQFVTYAAANAVGGACNLGVYLALVTTLPVFADHLWAAVALGSLAGWVINFSLSRRHVF